MFLRALRLDIRQACGAATWHPRTAWEQLHSYATDRLLECVLSLVLHRRTHAMGIRPICCLSRPLDLASTSHIGTAHAAANRLPYDSSAVVNVCVRLWRCVCGDVSVEMCLWRRVCGDVSVAMFLWRCVCGHVSVYICPCTCGCGCGVGCAGG